jgi:hypothetical protein
VGERLDIEARNSSPKDAIDSAVACLIDQISEA